MFFKYILFFTILGNIVIKDITEFVESFIFSGLLKDGLTRSLIWRNCKYNLLLTFALKTSSYFKRNYFFI